MIWRSLLYVPANVPAFVHKAQSRGADALILDLEDSVADNAKQAARKMLSENWEALRSGPSDLIVRINAPLRDAVRDLEAVVRPGLVGIYLPKITSPDHLRILAALVSELEAERDMPAGGIGLVPMIETPSALEQAFPIATASPQVVAITLGGEDLATACHMTPTPEALFAPRQRIVLAARAAGISPLGLLDSPANLDSSGLAELAVRSRQFGFDGAAVIHPAAIDPLNTGFLPDDAEIAEARRIVEALDNANSQGRASARIGTRMIDLAMRRRAEAIIERVRTIREK
ncbi:HpcH/HpaI aldolase/citrate lyase family protein [Flavimaricola marinus]|uniref:Citrate lyase subunit beta n=1 Tax=Flavimaricola marinus TaxID=1819565 RepID=A0A238LKS3_9RHOB|nr:CoA ester lyase [Flavimaricola marinus]SMY09994.1 Citrate lyase subunit beta [Flavimaricola marinus]